MSGRSEYHPVRLSHLPTENPAGPDHVVALDAHRPCVLARLSELWREGKHMACGFRFHKPLDRHHLMRMATRKMGATEILRMGMSHTRDNLTSCVVGRATEAGTIAIRTVSCDNCGHLRRDPNVHLLQEKPRRGPAICVVHLCDRMGHCPFRDKRTHLCKLCSTVLSDCHVIACNTPSRDPSDQKEDTTQGMDLANLARRTRPGNNPGLFLFYFYNFVLNGSARRRYAHRVAHFLFHERFAER